MDCDIEVQINRTLLNPKYKRIISIGQVVPHEVVGMANYSKNILVGCGGLDMINKSHMIGALYGMERMMGKGDTPVRKIFDYAEERYLSELPITYILTVTTNSPEGVVIHGLFIGRSRELFEQAVKLSQQKNLIYVNEPFQKVVVYLDPKEFQSTWLGNKAIYRTRMAMADGGTLLILAPGVRHFGEDEENDRLIRKYGYIGREALTAAYRTEPLLQRNQSVAAHLIHGSSDGRFNIFYAAPKLTREEVEGVGFNYADYDEMAARYDVTKLTNGYNTLSDGEEIFFIDNPALGLWTR